DDKGGDFIGLWQAVHGCSFARALDEIEGWLGWSSRHATAGVAEHAKRKKAAEEAPPDKERQPLGAPSAEYHYLNEAGAIIATVYRHDLVDEAGNPVIGSDGKQKKTFRVWNAAETVWKHPDPKPLYNIPNIVTARRVILTEGEKAAEALIGMGFDATSAMGGSKTPLEKTDWSPIQGKTVII